MPALSCVAAALVVAAPMSAGAVPGPGEASSAGPAMSSPAQVSAARQPVRALRVLVAGLPAGVKAKVRVRNAARHKTLRPAGTRLFTRLPAGKYRVTASSVRVKGRTFVPQLTDGTVRVRPGRGYPATVAALYTRAESTPPASERLPLFGYVDMTGWPTPELTSLATQSQQDAFTAAFVTSMNQTTCDPAWGGYAAYRIGSEGDFKANLDSFTQAGRSLVVSFGGALGTELAVACTDPSALQNAYGTVADRYDVTRLDFDIEGTALGDSAANVRRAAAVTQALVTRPGVSVSLTLPVMPYGLEAPALARVGEWGAALPLNLMAMDYGTGYPDMGDAAIRAAEAVAQQLGTLPAYASLTYAERLSLVGLTPMIGQNDVPAEVFSVADALDVTLWAREHGLFGVGWWSVTRDTPCATPTDPLYRCTRLPDPPWAFAEAFRAAAG